MPSRDTAGPAGLLGQVTSRTENAKAPFSRSMELLDLDRSTQADSPYASRIAPVFQVFEPETIGPSK